MTKPLTEKLRPEFLKDVAGHQTNKEVLSKWVAEFHKNGFQFPNMLFYGPPGTGKTSTAKAFAREIMRDFWPAGVLELNASDDRGIDIVRGRIKDFSSIAPMGPINIAILDEADKITAPAQAALRRIMETHNETTRFIVITNELEGIITPIQSRCSNMFFGCLSDEDMERYINMVAASESMAIEPDAIPSIIEFADGKPRDVLNILAQLSTYDIITKKIVQKIFKDFSGVKWDSLYRSIYTNPMGTDKKIVELLEKDGMNPRHIIEQFVKMLINDSNLNDALKAGMLIKLAEFDFRLAMRGTPRIQLRCMVWSFYHVAKKAGG